MTLGTISDRTQILMAPDVVRLTTAEVSAATGVAPATLRKWACQKTNGTLLPAVKRAGRNLYRPSDIRAWLGVHQLEVGTDVIGENEA